MSATKNDRHENASSPSALAAALASPRVAGTPFAKRNAEDRKAGEVRNSKPKKACGAEKKGPDGTVYQTRRIKTGTQAIATHKVRCRPGTFEWRYGRHGNSLYHAGAEFARLWEKAGIAQAGTSSIGNGGGGDWKGLPDGRLLALDRVRKIVGEIGSPIVRRLVGYCVEGKTPREMAGPGKDDERRMAIVLDQDLTDLARAMRFST